MWNYDKGGNITSKKEYALFTEDTPSGDPLQTDSYTYRDSIWKDQLLSYNGTAFVYDEIGNPTTYKGQVLDWVYARNLRRYGTNTFQYGADNIRYKKNNTVYTLDGSTILKETDGTYTITYYHGNGGVIGFCYKDAAGTETDYFFEKNLQGDVTRLCNYRGAVLDGVTRNTLLSAERRILSACLPDEGRVWAEPTKIYR